MVLARDSPVPISGEAYTSNSPKAEVPEMYGAQGGFSVAGNFRQQGRQQPRSRFRIHLESADAASITTSRALGVPTLPARSVCSSGMANTPMRT